jgi:hypothetical protein
MMKCCQCEQRAIVTFGFTKAGAKQYCQGLKTYYAYGQRSVLLAFCERHFELASTTWPGLAFNPVLPVHRYRAQGRLAIDRMKKRMEDPAIQRRIAVPGRERAIGRAIGEIRRGRSRERSLTDVMTEAARTIGIELKPGKDLTRAQLGELLAFIRTIASR